MCGIFGYSLRPGKNDRGRLKVLCAVLAAEMDHRGGHSWGFYAGGGLTKGLGTMSCHVRAKHLASFSDLMGHTRMATTGKVAVENCHPFEIGSVVGAHNGTVGNHDWLNKRYGRNLPVDSQHIFQHIEEGLPLEDVEAYGAVEMVLKDQPERIYLGHFHGGSLSVWSGSWGCTWASTDWQALKALRLADLHATELEINADEWHYAEAGTVYSTGNPIGMGMPQKKTQWFPSHSYDPYKDDDWKDITAEGRAAWEERLTQDTSDWRIS